MAKRNAISWVVVGRGRAGWHAQSKPGEWTRYPDGGGSRQGSVSSSGGDLDEYVKQATPGALVYDADEADQDAFVSLVISGPMLSTELAPDAVKPFSADSRACALRMAGPGGLTGAFQAWALASQDETFSGLDYVGIGVFEGLLRRVPGMKIGRVVKGSVAWEASK